MKDLFGFLETLIITKRVPSILQTKQILEDLYSFHILIRLVGVFDFY